MRPLLDPGAGAAFTDHLISASYDPDRGWSGLAVDRLDDLALHPATSGLHYGQVIFEGLKAHRGADGTMAVFRPYEHARRFQRSARRLAMPELPVETFVDAVARLVDLDQGLLSDDPGHSLYLRPLSFGADANLKLAAAHGYRFLLLAFVMGQYFGEHADAVAVRVSHEYSRAARGGTGTIKCSGNYAGSLLAQQQAEAEGFQQVVWLDAAERRWVEEMGGMNIFLVRGTGAQAEVVTPALTDTILPGITRDSLLTLAARAGYRTSEEHISIDDWRAGCASGAITEAFASGTAAVVTPIGRLDELTVGDGKPGPVTTALREALVRVQRGAAPDPGEWLLRPRGL